MTTTGNIFETKRYFESVLLGASARRSKEDLARNALLQLDRVERVLSIHKASSTDLEVCSTCKTTYPCQTRRALTGE